MKWLTNLFRKTPQKKPVLRGDFKNDFAFLEYITQIEIINLERNIKILDKKEKLGANTLFINNDMFENAVNVSVVNIINKISDDYRELMMLYFKDEDALIAHIVSLLFAFALQRVEESNKDRLNKKQLSNAFALFNKKKQAEQKKENNQTDEIVDAEHLEIPQVL